MSTNKVISPYSSLDTPSLIVDRDILLANLTAMQAKANKFGVKLRPHTKTHKMPEIAKLQIEYGASGITVAKVGEAEVMAAHGIKDIFIANEIVGVSKLERIRTLARDIHIRLGVDSTYQLDELDQVFAGAVRPIEVIVEVEAGEVRSGVIDEQQLLTLAKHSLTKKNVVIKGVFSHDGQSYRAESAEHAVQICQQAQERTLHMAEVLRQAGCEVDTVSIGSTPSLMQDVQILAGITEIRPGTYPFMDVGQGSAIQDYSKCAATILATVISKPTEERVVIDVGAKGLTAQSRVGGICATHGMGLIKNSDNTRLAGVFDEHGVINDCNFNAQVQIGQKVEVIPNHICPAVNLYDTAYLVSNGQIVKEIPVLCRGKLQ